MHLFACTSLLAPLCSHLFACKEICGGGSLQMWSVTGVQIAREYAFHTSQPSIRASLPYEDYFFPYED
jgi:hypothetical protein